MTTEVVLTGTGTPNPDPRRAGPGTLIRVGARAFQVDAGRATVLRLAAVVSELTSIERVLLTHHHSDHLTGLADLVLTRWTMEFPEAPLPILAPEGATADFARRLLDVWAPDIATRAGYEVEAPPPRVQVEAFSASSEPAVVWRDDTVTISAVAVHHEPVDPAVAYRIDGPDGAVVVSGDTRACDEVARLAAGADVLVHEVFRTRMLERVLEQSARIRKVAAYHADSVEVGRVAARAGVKVLVLTHLIPGPTTSKLEASFAKDARDGGFGGEVLVGRDLDRVVLEAGVPPAVLAGDR